MSIPPESIKIGRCYLARSFGSGREGYLGVRRVVEILPDGRVKFEHRRGPVAPGLLWPGRNTMRLEAFAISAEREISCDWKPEDGQEQGMR